MTTKYLSAIAVAATLVVGGAGVGFAAGGTTTGGGAAGTTSGTGASAQQNRTDDRTNWGWIGLLGLGGLAGLMGRRDHGRDTTTGTTTTRM